MKTLFIAHEFSRTGSVLQFLELLKLYKKETNVNIDLLLLNQQEKTLMKDFQAIVQNCYYIEHRKITSFVKNITKRDDLYYISINKIAKKKYDVIYGNTILTLTKLSELKEKSPNSTSILHIHEPLFLIQEFSKHHPFESYLKNVDYCIAVSDYVRKTLIEKYGFPAAKIIRIYPFYQEKDSIDVTQKLLDENLLKDKLILTTIGNPHLVKGSDLIPEIAEKLRMYRNDFIILVVGVNPNNKFLIEIKKEIEEKQLQDYIKFFPNTDKVSEIYGSSNLFLMISREESFSLVTVEALLHKIPIICFKDNGGPNEILGSHYPFYAGNGNTGDIVDNILRLSKNKDDFQKVLPELLCKIERYFNKQRNLSQNIQFIHSIKTKK